MDKTDIHSVWGGKFTINFFVTYSLPTTEKKMLKHVAVHIYEQIWNNIQHNGNSDCL